MKICFDFVCDEALIFSSSAIYLKEKGYEVCAITLGNRWKKARQEGIDVFPLDLSDNAVVDWKGEMERIKDTYGEKVSGFVQADRFLSKMKREDQIKILVWTFLKIEELVKNGVNIFFMTGVAYLYNLVILEVAKKNDLLCYSLYETRQAESRFTISKGEGGAWDIVDELYKNYLKDKDVTMLSKETEYIDSFREFFTKPDYMNSARQDGGISSVFVKEFIVRLRDWYLGKWSVKEDYITQNPFWYVVRDVKRIFNKKWLQAVFKFDKADYSEKYYIYPLHLQPEASTLVLGPDYVNQVETIKAISRRLPLGEYLYVKEHPAAFGRHSLGMYREISQLFNVKLISPAENTKKMINFSKGVIVVSGTMGWEAFLVGKPAIVLGNVFYDKFSGVYKIENIEEIGNLFFSELKVADKLEIAVALNAIYEGSFKGRFDVHKLDTSQIVLSEENLSFINSGIFDIVQNLSK